MKNNNNIEQSKMEIFADMMVSVDLARQATEKLNSEIVYLDFSNPKMIQRYFDGIQDTYQGLYYFKETFWHYAKAHNIELDRTIIEPE